MRVLMLSAVLVAAATTACVTENTIIEVEVKASTPKDAPHLQRNLPICFAEKSNSGEITKTHFEEAVRFCTSVAKSKGLHVVKPSEDGKCVLAQLQPHDDNLEITFYAPGKAPPAGPAHSIHAQLEDKKSALPARATVAMCRAAFQAYPDDLATRSYNAETSLPDGAPLKLASEHCVPADTWFWEIPRQVCTTDDNKICVRTYDKETQAGDCHARK